MSDFEAALRLLLSCSMCGTYYGYSDLVVACEQADAAALEDARAALHAEHPALGAERCGRREAPLPLDRDNDGDESDSNHGGDADTTSATGRTAQHRRAELTALIAELEFRQPGGDQQ
jgi:hypothetical protein